MDSGCPWCDFSDHSTTFFLRDQTLDLQQQIQEHHTLLFAERSWSLYEAEV